MIIPANIGRRRARPRDVLMAVLLVAATLGSPRARAEQPAPSVTHTTAEVPPGDTPRSTVRDFLLAARDGDWGHVAGHLDLRRLPPASRATAGPRLARQLKAVLDRTVGVDVGTLDDTPEGDREDDLVGARDRVATIETSQGPVDVLVERVREPDGERSWKIAAATVAQIPALAREFGRGPFEAWLPAPLVELRFLEIELWQWIGLLALGLLAAAVGWLGAKLAVRASVFASRSGTRLDSELVAAEAAPLRLALALLFFAAASRGLGLAVPAQGFVWEVTRALLVLAVAWLGLRLTDVLAHTLELRLVTRSQAAFVSMLKLGRRAVKVLVVLLASLTLVHNLGFNVTAVLAGLGVGGLAVALAAQKTLENLFGGVTLIADQPVRVGDFCRFGDRVGIIEDIGLRSTRVRTLDRTIVSIPNATFASLELENFALRDRIWLKTSLGLRYETTPDQLRWVLVEIKKLLLAHPKVHADPARVRFVGFGAYSLDLEIFAYVLTADINQFLAIREDILLRIMDIVAASGSGFAFPSQTIYTGADAGLDAARRDAAEEAVRRWRAESALCLPDVPPEIATTLADTLDYPPAGAAVRR